MGRVRKNLNEAANRLHVWKIAIYIRLSREDGQDESRSVSEQRKIIKEYVEQSFTEEYVIVDFYVDDGLTGTDDTRDEFKRMIADASTGKVNCIICKTLSRAFRNYADQGRYLEQVFPQKGIRFISVSNPHVDSYTDPDAIHNGMEIPINGLMNDRFAAKTSADIRRTFDGKRKRGEFIGAFAPYGYQKDPGDKNKLIIDEEAANVVKNIFSWFVNDGMSKYAIAKKLNEMGVPNPTEYKTKVKKMSYKNPHAILNDGKWIDSIITRMLKNEMYIGNMVQGRQRVISYKVHNSISVPEEEWFIVPNTHEAIIDDEMFTKAQALHARDTRTAPGKHEVYLFSGLVRCYDCKKAMRRKKSKNFVYYHCRTKTDKGICTKHVIRDDKLTQAVLAAIQMQIEMVDSLTEAIEIINSNPNINTQSTRLAAMLKLREQELQKVLAASDNLYMDWKNSEITKDEYKRMKSRFDEQAAKLTEAINAINDEIDTMAKGINSDDPYLTTFLKYRNIRTLERGILVELIDTIYIHEDGEITIDFNFTDELKRVADYIENNKRELTVLNNIAV